MDEMGMSVKRRSSRVLEEDEDTLRGSRLVSAAAAAASVSVSVRASRAPAAAGATDTPRADVSFGSWLAEGGFEVDEEHNDIRRKSFLLLLFRVNITCYLSIFLTPFFSVSDSISVYYLLLGRVLSIGVGI